MKVEQFLARFRWIFFRQGFLYILVLTIALRCVDVPGIKESLRIRRLNDMLAGINTSQLYAFSKGEIPASAVDWKGLIRYFATMIKSFPSDEDAEMFLGYCEYYGLGQTENAFKHFQHSADKLPFLFWNVYTTGLMLFEINDWDHAIPYLELALLIRSNMTAYIMENSMVYRQFFPMVFSPDLKHRFNKAHGNVVLLLAASFFYKHDYNKAGPLVMTGLSDPDITDREPFYFYAGAMAMAKGDFNEALSFFDLAIKKKSVNPLVYRYAADTLRAIGRQQEAQKISQIAQALSQKPSLDQFPYPSHLQLEFY